MYCLIQWGGLTDFMKMTLLPYIGDSVFILHMEGSRWGSSKTSHSMIVNLFMKNHVHPNSVHFCHFGVEISPECCTLGTRGKTLLEKMLHIGDNFLHWVQRFCIGCNQCILFCILHKVKVFGFFSSKGFGVQSLKAKSQSRKIQSMPIANVKNFVTEK